MDCSAAASSAAEALTAARRQRAPGKSFAFYLLSVQLFKTAAETDPESTSDYQEILDALEGEVVEAFSTWTERLMEKSSYDSLFAVIEEAGAVVGEDYPGVGIRTANLLARMEMTKEAASCFVDAVRRERIKAASNLASDRCRLPLGIDDAVDGLRTLLGALVPRWHFAMLNDRQRNEAFEAAIIEAAERWRKWSSGDRDFIQRPTRILDIGTGTGLFAMVSAREGCHVTACEMDSTMHSVAEQVLAENNVKKVTLINSHSSAMGVSTGSTPSTPRMEEKFDLVVAEILDSGVFGEGVISSIGDAWERLLKDDESLEGIHPRLPRVIPASIKIFVRGFESPALRSRILAHLGNHGSSDDLVGKSGDLKFVSTLASFSEGTFPDSEMARRLEPYTTTRLREDVCQFLTEKQFLTEINLNQKLDVLSLRNGETFFDATLLVQKEGIFDGVALWFDAALIDEDKKTSKETFSISTEPRIGSSTMEEGCWEQAVYCPIGPNFCSLSFRESDDLRLRFQLKDDYLRLVGFDASSATNIWTPSEENGSEISPSPVVVDSFCVAALNNTFFIAGITKAVADNLLKIAEEKRSLVSNSTAQASFVRVFEMAETLPIYCLEALVGVVKIRPDIKVNLVIVEEDESKREAVRRVIDHRRSDVGHVLDVRFLRRDELLRCDANAFDLIISDVIDKVGLLQNELFQYLPTLFKAGLVDYRTNFIPAKIEIVVTGLQSSEIVSASRVLKDEDGEGSATLGFRVAPWINLFQNDTHADLDLNRVGDLRYLTKEVEAMTIDMQKNLSTNKYVVNLECINEGTLNAIAVWFRLVLSEGIFSDTFDTKNSKSHWKQSAVFPPQERRVITGEKLMFCFKLRNGKLIVGETNENSPT